MMFRLFAGAVIVVTLAVMSPARQTPTLPGLADGLTESAAGAVRSGIAAAVASSPTSSRDPGLLQAGADAALRAIAAEQAERIRRNVAGLHETSDGSLDTLKAADRRPAWRSAAARP